MPRRRGELSLIACESGMHFAEKIFNKLKEHTHSKSIPSQEVHFANTEVKTIINESIREADVYIIQDVENSVSGYSVDENLRALKTAVDAAWRSDARYITAVLPVFPYARQDKFDGREGITAAMVAREIEDANANHVITMDIHNTAIAGFFRKAKLENLLASKNIIDYLKNNTEFDLENMMIMAPDLGGAKRAEHYAQELGTDIGFVYKKRSKDANKIEKAEILGDVKEKDVLIIDDMVDTGGTTTKIAKLAKDRGAEKVYAGCSLPLFNGPAIERIEKAHEQGYLTAVIGTDAVYQGNDFQQRYPWYMEVSVASYFSKVIYKLNQRQSISKLLE